MGADVGVKAIEEPLEECFVVALRNRGFLPAAANAGAKVLTTVVGPLVSAANNAYDLRNALNEATETKRQVLKLRQVLRRDLEPKINDLRRKRDGVRKELNDCLQRSKGGPA
jgi:hypothetical protein